MPTAKRKSTVPSQNVLDLRKILAERQAAARTLREERRHLRVLSSILSGRQPAADWHVPRVERDWSRVWSEAGKFLLIVAVAMVPLLLAVTAVRAAAAAQVVQSRAADGVAAIERGTAALGTASMDQAVQQFTAAERALVESQTVLERTAYRQGRIVSVIPWIGTKYVTAAAVIQAGQHVARAGRRVAESLTDVTSEAMKFSVKTEGVIEGTLGPLGPLLAKPDAARAVAADLDAAGQALQPVDANDLPVEVRDKFAVWQRLSPLLTRQYCLTDVADVLLGILAAPEPQEFLLVFQNNDELRAIGGFPGTYLLIKFENGGFKVLDSPGNGPYALTEFTPQTKLPPEPLRAITPFWNFQDSTWFLDAPSSARAMLDVYASARGFRPDGVIFVSPGLIEDLLRITGPISLPAYGQEVSADTFVRTAEQQVEVQYDKALNAPKRFLIDLFPVLLQRLATLPGPAALRAVATIVTHANAEDLLIYSDHQSTEKTLTRLGWDGAILRPATGDFLAVVDSNLGGTKTDRVVSERVDVTVEERADRRRYRLAVTRRHDGQASDPLAGKPNREFIRVYAPAGAQLVSVDGQTSPDTISLVAADPAAKVDEKIQRAEGRVIVDQTLGVRITGEGGKTVFGVWLELDPGQTKTLTLAYDVPSSRTDESTDWLLTWQKQPGAPERQWTVRYDVPSGRRIRSVTAGGRVSADGRTATFTASSSTTRVFGAVR